MRFCLSLAAALAGLALTACDGGHSSSEETTAAEFGHVDVVAGQRVALTGDNYGAAAGEAAAVGLDMSLSSDDVGTLAASLTGPGGSIAGRVRDQVARLAATDVDGPPTLTGASAVNTVPCAGGGTRQITTVDGNGNQHLDAGETVSVLYTHCVTPGMVEEGVIQLTFHATPTGTLGGDVYTLDVTAGMQGYTTTETNRTRETHGTLRLVSSRSAQNQGVDTTTSSGLVNKQTISGVTQTRTLTEYLAIDSISPAQTSSTLKGVVSSTALQNGSVSFETTSPFLRRINEAYAYAGSAVATGARGGKAKLTAMSSALVSVTLDANGDGIDEQTFTQNWTAVR